jgi:eukaryotic-like serine/threonine-protein kinase
MVRRTRYHVVNKIAHGGMAEIFLALQTGEEGFQKPVVLKRILPALAADPSFVRMLVDEAHIASTLNHSNLVQVLDLGKSRDQYFLVLEFVDGWSLEQVRRRAQHAKLKLPLPLALHVVGALCRGLAYVHTRTRNGKSLGIVHRDVTPQNVLLSREGEVKLADFGIAKAIGKSEKSATGVIKGKFAYMSPEQSMGAPLDGRSDLFSVGTLLYLLTTGRKPFDGPTDLDVIIQVRRARYEKPSTISKDYNPDVARLIARALRVDVSRRWQSAEQVADRIDAILVKLGQPSGPAPLKRWLESLSARDGAKPPAEAPAATDASIAIDLGSLDLELQEVSPAAGGDDAFTRPEPTRAEATAYNAPTRLDAARAARLAKDSRSEARESARAADALQSQVAALTLVGRFRRWVRRTTIRLVVILVLLGGGFYIARPHLPGWAARPVEAWLRRLPPPLGRGEP